MKTDIRHGRVLYRERCYLFSGIDIDSSESLESVNWDECDKGVKFLCRVFVFVSLSVESDADSVLDISNSALPDGLIQARVDTNI